MKWTTISGLQGKKFRRYKGIYRSVYEAMLRCIKSAKLAGRKHPTRGVSPKLSIEDKLLITVLYGREYRDQSHLTIDYGVS